MNNLSKKEGKYAIFEYSKKDENLIDELIKYLDDCAKDIYSFFEIEPDNNKIKYKIIKNKSEYDKEYRRIYEFDENYDVPNSYIGCFHDDFIMIVSFNDYKNIESHKDCTFNYYKQTIVHEFVHYVNALFRKVNNCGYTEQFLSEGIACYLSHQKEGQNAKLTSSIDELINKNQTGNYDNYFVLVKYLVENYDKKFVLNLFQSNRQAREFLKSELYDKVKSYCANNKN